MKKNLLPRLLQASLMCCLSVLFTACDDMFATEDNPIPAYLSMSTQDVTIKVDGEYTRTAIAVSSAVVEYTSSDPAIATVNQQGTVKGVAEGTATITATATGYSTGGKKMFITASVSYKVKVMPKALATITTAPTATASIAPNTATALVTAGVADGGTMMYAVTTTNTKPTTTDGFSATIPTAATLTAGTYYVWYYAKADATHSDSEISATAITVTVAYALAKDATNTDKGKLICTDGHIHAYGEDAECTKARVAKIIYVGSSTDNTTYTHGLALALTEESKSYWGAANTACTNKNTSTAVTGASWMLPSKPQWETMMGAEGAGSYTALVNGFSGVDGTDMHSNEYYWSSSTASTINDAWCFYDSNIFYELTKEGMWENYVRACLAF